MAESSEAEDSVLGQLQGGPAPSGCPSVQRGTRSSARLRGMTSPQTTMDTYCVPQPPRKAPRISHDPLRVVRQKGARGAAPRLTGYLGTLPSETLEQVLGYCGARELAALETTCAFFVKSGVTDRVAAHFLAEIPRAKGLRPDFRRGETYCTLLNFVQGQSNAAAQGTAVALGTFHTVALLAAPGDAAAAAGAAAAGGGADADGDGDGGDGASGSAPPPLPEGVDYQMHACGRGFHGQLGNDGYANASRMALVAGVDRAEGRVPLYRGAPDDVQLAVVAAGSSHSASISRRGELFTWGLASSGELGHGGWTPIEVAAPRAVTSLHRTRVVSVCAGANHTLAISEAGQLWACGRGRHGQLGLGHFHDEGLLTLVEGVARERVVSAAAGRGHSVALAADGKIFTWGDGRRGQLGHAALAALMAQGAAGGGAPPVAVPFPQAITALDPARLRPPARVTAIAAGGDHSMAVTVGGALLAFGCNAHGQLGTGDAVDRMTPTQVALAPAEGGADAGAGGAAAAPRAMQVQCGAQHSLVLVQAGGRQEVRAAGGNAYGQLGLGDRRDRWRFERVPALAGRSVTCVAAGDWHCAAVGADGRLWTWGRGDVGQLGHGDDRARWAPTLMAGARVVHPDRTLRRNRRPVLKPLLLRDKAEKQATHLPGGGRRG